MRIFPGLAAKAKAFINHNEDTKPSLSPPSLTAPSKEPSFSPLSAEYPSSSKISLLASFSSTFRPIAALMGISPPPDTTADSLSQKMEGLSKAMQETANQLLKKVQ